MTISYDTLAAMLRTAPVVPLINSADVASARWIADTLARGGLGVLEVVLRTPQAMDVVEALADNGDEAIVGAGTVLSAAQASEALARGAQFIVSPGLDEGVVTTAQRAGVPVLPGVATASEAQRAWNLGLRHVKFFPAGQAGGTAMLKALGAVFKDLAFMPTGGVGPDNLADYLALPQVLACGGSWLTPADAVAQRDDDALIALCRDALAIARSARPRP